MCVTNQGCRDLEYVVYPNKARTTQAMKNRQNKDCMNNSINQKTTAPRSPNYFVKIPFGPKWKGAGKIWIKTFILKFWPIAHIDFIFKYLSNRTYSLRYGFHRNVVIAMEIYNTAWQRRSAQWWLCTRTVFKSALLREDLRLKLNLL